ncbi:molybdopterin molybdotransferase MoeA [Rufibacter roseus]|uniref:Molybdopterin molybdenumtransferase n=1 Tax=Rufibacter roseus TaxID=1567108 RepID=A0ABW2DJD9_9BACT|nr:molybdopterin molybdotransferase MoeA [Rufibacter roseus]
MVTVQEAEAIIRAQTRDFGIEELPFEQALRRVLAEDLKTDRDLPPFNRVAMDGIAVKYEAIAQGTQRFKIVGTQAAGGAPLEVQQLQDCIEIMTGAALPPSVDTVIRYEDLEIQNGIATVLTENVHAGQNLHRQGQDKKQGEVVVAAAQVVTPAVVSMAAAVGETQLRVKKLPKVVVISTGDELVDVEQTPLPYQIRRSNSYMVKAALQQFQIKADMLHLPDDIAATREELRQCLQQYEVVILSGGISAGKFDFVPQVLEELVVQKRFHKVQQKPGKPFWFGTYGQQTVVFALPGNPVSTFLCLHRYCLPWLHASLGLPEKPKLFASLAQDISFKPQLCYFVQVQLHFNEQGQLLATPFEGNGSGDFANLIEADAFLELPPEQSEYNKGEVYRVWPMKSLL